MASEEIKQILQKPVPRLGGVGICFAKATLKLGYGRIITSYRQLSSAITYPTRNLRLLDLIKEAEIRNTSFDMTSFDNGIIDLMKWLCRHAHTEQCMQT